MIRNANGFWMGPKFFMSAGDGGASAGDAGAAGDTAPGGDGADASNDAGNGTDGSNNTPDGNQGDNTSAESLNAEIARLKAELARNKDSLNKATKEAGDLRKELRSKQTQEEIDAEEKAEAAQRTAQELEDLRKEVAKGKTVKTVMGKLGLDEDTAGGLADALYGAADIDNALLQIQKAWQAKEKALRLEFGKVTGPGAGADSNSPEALAVKRAAEIGKSRNATNEQAQKAMQAYLR